MQQSKRTSITDLPKNANEKDNFGIEPFEKGLIRFIKHTNTPITIALQGEWGSGKTSLMNSLRMKLSENDSTKHHSIWLNTWEYSLMKDAQSTLMDIISDLIKETSKIAKVDETTTKKLLNTLWSGIKDTSKVVAKNTLDKTVSGAGSIVDAFSSSGKSSIGDVRNELEQTIGESIKQDNKDGYIFFIDDLDRIDPPVAVELLELLKNIFTLKNCVFVLAIDYDVVIKGLEPKFGKLTASNEREFRSFFDKIIQVPFSMPVSSYRIDDFLKESLVTTNYLNEEQVKSIDLISKFSEISNLTVGTNPRALKRLMNSLSLISCINLEKENTEESDQLNEELELLVNFALVSIQIAYPPIYRLLTLHSGFEKWDESVALQMNLPELDKTIKEKLEKNEEFDEEWEQVVFRICENDHYLKKKSLNISRLLNTLKKSIEDKGEDIENIIGAVISLSSVTSIEAFDKQEVSYHKGNLLKDVRKKLIKKLKEKMPELANTISQQGTRVQSNAFIKFTKNDWQQWIKLHSHPFEGEIRLIITTSKWVGEITSDYKTDWKKYGIDTEMDNVIKEYVELGKNSHPVTTLNEEETYNEIGKNRNHHEVSLYGYLVKPDANSFYSEQSIDELANFISGLYRFMVKIGELHNVYEKNRKG